MKRGAFPRFYFLSDDELLEILANSASPQSVQPHLKKCFDNIYKLDFGEDSRSFTVYAMVSAEGEKVPFNPVVLCKGEVESWLTNIQIAMIDNLTKAMKKGLDEYQKVNTDFKVWVVSHPGQIVATIS
jgi:dynein heavy chain